MELRGFPNQSGDYTRPGQQKGSIHQRSQAENGSTLSQGTLESHSRLWVQKLKVTVELFRQIEAEELEKIKQAIGAEKYASHEFDKDAQLLDNIITEERFVEFLTLHAYQYLP